MIRYILGLISGIMLCNISWLQFITWFNKILLDFNIHL
jgi:hypothetical protein